MKFHLFGGAIFVASSLVTYAQAQTASVTQLNFVKKVYADQLNDDLFQIDIIKLHASKEMRQLIAQRDAIADRHLGDMCDWVESTLIPGNDFDTRLSQMKFTGLSNGLIRAQGTNFGQKFHVDFDIKCDANGCKIHDLFTPNSYKKELQSIIRKNQC